MILNLVLLAILIICIAFLWNEGMWSNAITFMNALLAGMIATSFFEPLADFLDQQMPTYTYFVDFLALWSLFAVSFLVLRAVSDRLSRTRVRFKMPVEHTGRMALAVLTGWVLVAFTTMTLHTAPLSRNSFRGSFQPTAESKSHFFGLAPDRAWLGFIQQASRGSFAFHDPAITSPDPRNAGKRVFDPNGEFIVKYGTRRHHLSQEPAMRVNR